LKEISFRVKGKRKRRLMPLKCLTVYWDHLIEINNEPVKNTIALEKGTDQNLTRNWFSEFVPILWFKVNLS
jgi:hypothetical protein